MTIVTAEIENDNAKQLAEDVLSAVTFKDGQAVLDTARLPTELDIAAVETFIANLNAYIKKVGMNIRTPADLAELFETYAGETLLLLSRPDPALASQQTALFNCFNVRAQSPHSSSTEPGRVKAKAAGDCTVSGQMNSPTFQLYLYLEHERKSGWFTYWSKVAQSGPHIRTGYNPRWSSSSVQVRASCVNGNYRATGSIRVSASGQVVIPNTVRIQPAERYVNCY